MTHSSRHTPRHGVAADSDKHYKRTEHRRERVAVRVALITGALLPHPKRYGNPWNAPKDGKHWLSATADAKWMRK